MLQAQQNYWNFAEKLTGRKVKDRVSHEVNLKLDDEYTITFLCYNTSLCTKIHESVGGLMIPEDKFLQPSVDSQNNIIISIFHHNSGWLSPSTNNKKLFEKHVFETSDIVICGHEHDRKERLESSLQGDEQLVYLEGAAFQYGHASEYYINVIDTETLECEKHTLRYQASVQPDLCMYRDSIETFVIHNRVRGLQLRKDFDDRLQKLPIKITHPIAGDLRLSGCIALDLAYLAGGKYDASLSLNNHVCSMAAGLLLVKEAGGAVRGMAQKDMRVEDLKEIFKNGNLSASNFNLSPKVAEIFK